MFEARREVKTGEILRETFNHPKFDRHINGTAKDMLEAIRSGIPEDDGDLRRDGPYIIEGTEDRVTIVGVSGEHPNTGGRPIADTLSVAWLINFGTSAFDGAQFMELGAAVAERAGFRRGDL